MTNNRNINPKEAKILYAMARGICAFENCRENLVVDATEDDPLYQFGEMAHIVAHSSRGPRGDPNYPTDKINKYENLILLCPKCHKKIDAEKNKYTIEILRKIKKRHEKWASEKFNKKEYEPVRLRRPENDNPNYLFRFTSGEQLVKLIETSLGISFGHDELKSQDEAELIGCFFQYLKDFRDTLSELEISDRVELEFELTNLIKKLEKKGFFVLCGEEIQILEGGIGKASEFPIAIINVLSRNNSSIKSINLKEDNPAAD